LEFAFWGGYPPDGLVSEDEPDTNPATWKVRGVDPVAVVRRDDVILMLDTDPPVGEQRFLQLLPNFAISDIGVTDSLSATSFSDGPATLRTND
jgi:hypothetical protein